MTFQTLLNTDTAFLQAQLSFIKLYKIMENDPLHKILINNKADNETCIYDLERMFILTCTLFRGISKCNFSNNCQVF